MRICFKARWEEKKKGEGCQLIRPQICLDFQAHDRSGKEGWLKQDGKVCDKRNSSNFIVPLWHSTSVILETWINIEKQDGDLLLICWEENIHQLLVAADVKETYCTQWN